MNRNSQEVPFFYKAITLCLRKIIQCMIWELKNNIEFKNIKNTNNPDLCKIAAEPCETTEEETTAEETTLIEETSAEETAALPAQSFESATGNVSFTYCRACDSIYE